jgi:hypothetical protein
MLLWFTICGSSLVVAIDDAIDDVVVSADITRAVVSTMLVVVAIDGVAGLAVVDRIVLPDAVGVTAVVSDVVGSAVVDIVVDIEVIYRAVMMMAMLQMQRNDHGKIVEHITDCVEPVVAIGVVTVEVEVPVRQPPLNFCLS